MLRLAGLSEIGLNQIPSSTRGGERYRNQRGGGALTYTDYFQVVDCMKSDSEANISVNCDQNHLRQARFHLEFHDCFDAVAVSKKLDLHMLIPSFNLDSRRMRPSRS